jgi:hypothetical protein
VTVSPLAATTRPDQELRLILADLARRVAVTERATTANPDTETEIAAQPVADRLAALEARVAALEQGASP